jgi:DNA-binding NarL/FixJ family response regulator
MPADVDAIVLDQNLAGPMTGLEAAPRLKARAPSAVIVLFSALDLERQARSVPAIDAVVRKDRVTQLPDTIRSLLDGAVD